MIRLVVMMMMLILWMPSTNAQANSHFTDSAYTIEDNLSLTQEIPETDAQIQRYRSGRRAYRPTPGTPPPARAVPPRADTPRRTGGFLGGMGGFLAGAFIGSMLFGGLVGGLGDFNVLGLLIDILVIAVIFILLRRFWTRMQERQRH